MTDQLATDHIPDFAVIGRVNEGKSSVVATLTENDRIVVGPDPGTTEQADEYVVRGDGHRLFRLVDTPGFEEPEAALKWMQERSAGVGDRATTVRSFVETFQGTERFVAECRLLQPILDGAAILYVVSSHHPFRPGFEAEMEILRWTGQPRLALINRGQGGVHTAEWKQALGQYFNIVKEFDAHASAFRDRMQLLDALRVIDDGLAPALDKAIQILGEIQERRLRRASEVIAATVTEMLCFRIKLDENEAADPNKNAVIDRFHNKLRKLEKDGRQQIEDLFAFTNIQRVEPEMEKPIYDRDLFAEETWQFLGQTRVVLITLGSVVGGIVGGALDAKTAGATGFLGAPIGALLGAASAAGATVGQPEARIKGMSVAGRVLTIGPHKDPNFGWVVLDRSLLHLQALVGRTHAMRSTLTIAGNTGKTGLVQGFDKTKTFSLGKVMAKIQKSDSVGKHQEALAEQLYPHVRKIAEEMGAAPKRRV